MAPSTTIFTTNVYNLKIRKNEQNSVTIHSIQQSLLWPETNLKLNKATVQILPSKRRVKTKLTPTPNFI